MTIGGSPKHGRQAHRRHSNQRQSLTDIPTTPIAVPSAAAAREGDEDGTRSLPPVAKKRGDSSSRLGANALSQVWSQLDYIDVLNVSLNFIITVYDKLFKINLFIY